MFKTIANIFLNYQDRYLIDEDVFFYDDIDTQETYNKLMSKLELNGINVRELASRNLNDLKETGHKYLIVSERLYNKYVLYSYSYLDNINDFQRIDVKKYLGV